MVEDSELGAVIAWILPACRRLPWPPPPRPPSIAVSLMIPKVSKWPWPPRVLVLPLIGPRLFHRRPVMICVSSVGPWRNGSISNSSVRVSRRRRPKPVGNNGSDTSCSSGHMRRGKIGSTLVDNIWSSVNWWNGTGQWNFPPGRPTRGRRGSPPTRTSTRNESRR